MYSQVINYIKQRVEIIREEIEESLKYSDFKKYAKGDYILRAGEYCRFIGFLNKGFIVTTFVDESGNEKASEFKHEGCFIIEKNMVITGIRHWRKKIKFTVVNIILYTPLSLTVQLSKKNTMTAVKRIIFMILISYHSL